MRHLALSLLLLLACAAAPPAAAQDRSCLPGLPLVQRILDGVLDGGKIPLQGGFALDESLLDEGRLNATISVVLDLRAARLERLANVCAAVVAEVDGELHTLDDRSFAVDELARGGADAWRYSIRLDLDEATSQLFVLLQDPASGAWGMADVVESGEAPNRPGRGAVRLDANAWYDVAAAGRKAVPAPDAADTAAPTVLRLVPPRNQPATGGTRFDALVSTDAVREVAFELDGKEVERQRRRPFVARIDLAKPARPQTVRAVAFDADGRVMGADEVTVNQSNVPFRVRISDWTPQPDGIAVTAGVSVPQGGRLEKVELYLNDLLVETWTRPPFRGVVPTVDPGPEEYVRVAATLADGSSIDDVILLANPGQVEQVEVNLVELHMVVTDADDRPVENLKPEDVQVVHRGKQRQIESFSYADDVPLVLGLVIDTSGSMRLVMEDTRRAAARFLGQTLRELDKAFVVDFDKQPRLLQDTTDDMVGLLTSLSQLVAEGETAMYDAIVFSMLQFEREGGRKALVVLTDGDDRDSRYGPKHSVEFAQKAGVPVYVIGLSELDGFRRVLPKKDLRQLTSETGGRLYFVITHDDLGRAYEEINAELRSQYTLTFYADSDLTEEERREVEVRVQRPGLQARTVIGTDGQP